MEFKPDFRLIVAIYIGLLLFGFIFNRGVELAERRGFLEGFTWLAVVIGVAITLAALALVSLQWALVMLGAFSSSGLPMAMGAIWRYVSARTQEQRDVRQTAGMAQHSEGGARPGGGGSDAGDPASEADCARGAKFYRD